SIATVVRDARLHPVPKTVAAVAVTPATEPTGAGHADDRGLIGQTLQSTSQAPGQSSWRRSVPRLTCSTGREARRRLLGFPVRCPSLRGAAQAFAAVPR